MKNKNWRDKANCVGMDPSLFFEDHKLSLRAAITVCMNCEVREACLEDALQLEVSRKRYGVRGGLTPSQRESLCT